MKKVFFTLAISFVTLLLNAQTKTYSPNDANLDGEVNISDVNCVISEICGTASSRKVVPLDSLVVLLRSVDKTFAETIEKKLGVEDSTVTTEASVSNLLPGKFSVSATKQVQFTKSNLYWDGSNFHFEENQTDHPTTWSTSHVGHFFWTNLTDYKSGAAQYMPYAENYSYSSQSTTDKFWCGEENPLTVEGTDGLYALTGSSDNFTGSSGEWYHLICVRTNAISLCKYGVTVTNGGTSYTDCLIIAPDDFTGTLQSSYTLDEVNAAGLVCLPVAGSRYGSLLGGGGYYGSYWSATPTSSGSNGACDLNFYWYTVFPANTCNRYIGCTLRLVRNCKWL